MPLTLGTNIASLRSQRRLLESERELGSVFERLSSGQRINRASDDAAGLAVASNLNTRHRVYSQGIRNINDGISALNIADAALNQLTSITIRITELAEQAATGSLSNQQRASLDTEAQALADEFLRIAQSTEFNGNGLLDGTLDELRLQAGYGDAGGIASVLGGALADGTFTQGSTYDGGALRTQSLGTGDFNGDGNIDMVTGGNAGAIEVHLGDGAGGFTAVQSITGASGNVNSVQIGDLNDDGQLDFSVIGGADGNVSVYLGDGTGTFSAGQRLTTGLDNGYGLELKDFNGDGILDAAAAGKILTAGTVGVFLGQGDGTFAESAAYSFGTGEFSAIGEIESGDFNGDGVVDLLVVGQDPPLTVLGVRQILYGVGDGTFSEGTRTKEANSFAQAEVGDINGDGLLDYITGDSSGDIYLYLNQGNDTFSTQTISSSNAGVMQGLGLVDVTGDGLLDIVTGNEIGRLAVLEGDGTGNFSEEFLLSGLGGAVNELQFADIDNDGVLDILSGIDNATSNITVLTGDSTSGVNPLLEFDLSTQAGALQALAPLEDKLSQLSEQRGVIGAFQSRLESASRTLTSSRDNYVAAESRIRDADIAAETSDMIRLQILRNSSVAVLGQANLQPSLSLQLLGGL